MRYLNVSADMESLEILQKSIDKKSSQFWLCIFELFSNVIEHNFYGLKLPACAPRKYKRLKIQFHKNKILCKLEKSTLTLCFNPKIPPSKAFLRLFCNPNLHQKAKRRQKQKLRQSGRGMVLIFTYSQPKLATMRHNKLSLTIKAKAQDTQNGNFKSNPARWKRCAQGGGENQNLQGFFRV
ncbi:hypothetical protein CQA49_06445 [Helicobacter sp. MIT 00-7814]|uniref:hypothetical protein n=1 Tax=unclassified Helicobacter TaxID=2593540 RepID=UPI000E1E9471|nr:MULTISPECIES: hypothetical protein [unclassified Helicobacter]RDU53555.1 hypothetical protein CQA49_06445 [Helicobacter sp. MIT 00-7814]RDU57019.1 hypothetical protein CQA37_01020 [Helicobacter sp. MIT 99-10781]